MIHKFSPHNANKGKTNIFKKSSLIRCNGFFKDLETFKLRGKPKTCFLWFENAK